MTTTILNPYEDNRTPEQIRAKEQFLERIILGLVTESDQWTPSLVVDYLNDNSIILKGNDFRFIHNLFRLIGTPHL